MHTVWCNQELNSQQEVWLRSATEGHSLILSRDSASAVRLSEATIAFGHPPLDGILNNSNLQWVQVASAGYGGYDVPECREVFAQRAMVFTKSSAVYAEPCAQHVLACLLAGSRRLPNCTVNQLGTRQWLHNQTRSQSRLLRDQKIVLVGFGSIGERLVEMLRPFTSNIIGIRRQVSGQQRVPMLVQDSPEVAQALAKADHVVNLLPGIASTQSYFDTTRLGQIQPGAYFYNVGRGSTVDHDALIALLQSGHLASAWLDVTNPEPLPPEHPLWTTPNCFITPHSAGGHHNEVDRLVQHFIDNFSRFLAGKKLEDRAF